jgi:hypothetical protein
MPLGISRFDEARLQGRLWTPAMDRAKTAMWFKAEPGGFAYATGVSQWNDKSGNGWHATQATGGSQPTYEPFGFNGRPAIRFAGGASTQFLTLASIASTGWSGLGALYAWKVTNYPGTDPNIGPVLGQWGTEVSADHEPFSDGQFYHGFGSTARKTVGAPPVSPASPRISAISSAAGAWSYWIDGTQVFSTGTNTVGLNTAPKIGNSFTYYLDGHIGEVIIMPSEMTTRERQMREGYLAWHNGLVENLVGSHPFKNRPPLIGD